MRINWVRVEGVSDAGPFAGILRFGPGLCVISGPNGYGKSTATKAISWCMGLEALYGVQAGDPSFFPIYTSIDLAGMENVKVHSVVAAIEVERDDGCTLNLRREVCDNSRVIQVTEKAGGLEVRDGALQIGHGSMQLEHAGFQRFLFEWFGIPIAELTRKQGGLSPIYLENLAPLFFIEQLDGWTEIQSRQVYRYGINEVGEGAVEVLLGLSAHLESRKQRQQVVTSEGQIRQEMNSIFVRYQEVIGELGWSDNLQVSGSFVDVLSQVRGINFLDRVKVNNNFSLERERTRLVERISRLKTELTQGSVDQDRSRSEGVAELAQGIISLKTRRGEVIGQMGDLRVQTRQLQGVERDLELRLNSAKDLIRLRSSGVGILPEAHCPTCGQNVSPDGVHMEQHPVDEVGAQVAALEREIKTIKRNRRTMLVEARRLSAELHQLETRLEADSRTLQLANEAIDPVRESLVRISHEIVRLEGELQANIRIWRRLTELQRALDECLHRATQLQREFVASLEAEQGRVLAFSREVGKLLGVLGHSAVKPENLGDVALDERYTPRLRNKRLDLLGSASDRARLIMAYVWALASVATAMDGHHPGILVLDEPLQQNPDRKHVDFLIRFLIEQQRSMRLLGENARELQVILITFLLDQDIRTLENAGVPLTILEDTERFLKLVSDDKGSRSLAPSK